MIAEMMITIVVLWTPVLVPNTPQPPHPLIRQSPWISHKWIARHKRYIRMPQIWDQKMQHFMPRNSYAMDLAPHDVNIAILSQSQHHLLRFLYPGDLVRLPPPDLAEALIPLCRQLQTIPLGFKKLGVMLRHGFDWPNSAQPIGVTRK